MASRYKRVSPSFTELPEELHINIFFRLPVRSVLSCKCVCKLFRTLIQNPDPEHSRPALNRSISSGAYTSELLLVQCDHDINIVSVDNTTNDVISSTPMTRIIPYIRDLILVGSCNGLVCFSARTKRKWDNMLLLWNPVTGNTKYLPEQPRLGFYHKPCTEFFFVPETNDYIVLIIGSPYRSQIRVAVYKMSTDSWTINCSNISVPDPLYLKHQITPVFVNGSFYWGVDGQGNIISYNPKDDKFGEINTPVRHNENTKWNLAVIEESLGVMYWNYRGKEGEVLILKQIDCRVQGSWSYYKFRNSLLSPLLGHWKDFLITTDSSNLYLYDSCSHKRKQWIPQSGLPRVCSFLDTVAA